MANIKQQKKRVLTNEKRRQRNKSFRSATRTEIVSSVRLWSPATRLPLRHSCALLPASWIRL